MIAILDYGSGNLRSAERAFLNSGAEVLVTSDFDIAMSSKGLVVPGVGAFGACMAGLKKISGDRLIRERAAKNLPILGICVGMQILFENGVENGAHQGVGVLKGTVERMNAKILPHMGWNLVSTAQGSKLFAGVENERFYFVHSYAVKNSAENSLTFCNYEEDFVAAVESGPISATQFHPEKSGEAGLKLIKNWINSL